MRNFLYGGVVAGGMVGAAIVAPLAGMIAGGAVLGGGAWYLFQRNESERNARRNAEQIATARAANFEMGLWVAVAGTGVALTGFYVQLNAGACHIPADCAGNGMTLFKAGVTAVTAGLTFALGNKPALG